MDQVETTTELEEILIDRIRKMSIDEQHEFLQFLNETFPELMEVEQEPQKIPEPEIPPIEQQQNAVTISQDIANSGGLDIDDSVESQREQRQDRPLPGRED